MNLYKSFIVYFIGFLIIITSMIYPFLIYIQLGVPTESSRYIEEWFDKKISYADTIIDPKILIVSGSNTLFGVSAQAIELKYNIPTVNMGSHAGLGMEYIFYQVKQILNPGDIVIIPLEYSHYIASEELNETFIDYIMARDVGYLNNKNLISKVKFLSAVQPGRVGSGIKEKFILTEKKIGKYDAKYLNRNGDMTNYTQQLNLNGLLLKMHTGVFQGISDITPDSKQCLLNFIEYCEMNKIKLLATYPPFLYQNENFSGNDLVMIENIKKFWQENNIPVLGEYKEFIYDIDNFYDTIYHLNVQGKEKNTARLIKYLEPYL